MAQTNLVLNGSMDELDSYTRRDKGDWLPINLLSFDTLISEDPLTHACHAVVTKYWDTIETRGRFAIHHEANSGAYYRILNIYKQLDKRTYKISVDRATLCSKLKKGNAYLVSIQVKPLNGNIEFGHFSMLLTDKVYAPLSFIDIEESNNYKNYYGNNYYTYPKSICSLDGYTNISFEYIAKGDEQYIYIGYLDIVFLKRIRMVKHFPTDCFTCQYPVFSLAIDDLKVSPLDTSEHCTPTAILPIQKETVINTNHNTNEIDSSLVYTYFYQTDKFEVDERLSNFFDTLCLSIKQNRFVIVGHTDSIGSEQYNINLSLKRANYCASLLAKKCSKTISTKGMGNSFPIEKLAHSSLNRRVEIYVLKDE